MRQALLVISLASLVAAAVALESLRERGCADYSGYRVQDRPEDCR